VRSIADSLFMSATLNKRWYVFRDGRQYGPITDGKLHDLVQGGQVKQDDYLWCPDFTDWIRFDILDPVSLTPPSSSRFRFVRSFKRFLGRHLFAKRISVFKKVGQIVSRPSDFAEKYIKDGEPNALFASMMFYAKVFVLSFAVVLISEQFRFYEGGSEVRGLVIMLVPQLIVGTLVLFLLLLITGNRVPLDGLLQTILYVDAVYLLFDALVGLPLSYLNYALTPAGPREVDLFASELEKCLTAKSFAYWLIRGDLQFFMHDDKWQFWAQRFIDLRQYITVIPFAFLFAQMIRTRYKGNFTVVVIATCIAFGFTIEAYAWVQAKARQALENKTNCESSYVQTIVSKYSTERIAKQLEFKLSNPLNQIFAKANMVFWLDGNEYIIAIKVDPNAVSPAQLSGAASQFFRSSYCSPHPYWSAMRKMRYSLTAFVFHQERTIFALRLKPDDCPPA